VRLHRILCLTMGLVPTMPLSAAPPASTETGTEAGRNVAAERLDPATAERSLRRELRADPENPETRFRLARVLSWQEKYAEAEQHYRKLVAQHPENGDFRLGLAQVLVWSGNKDQAIPLLEQLSDGGRKNPDAIRLLLQCWSSGTRAQREAADRLRADARRNYPNEDFGATAPASAPPFHGLPPNQIEVGGGYDRLSNGRAPWNSQYLMFSKQFQPHTNLYGGVQHTERFGLDDVQLHLGGYLPLADRWTANLEAGYSPTGRVLPQHYELVHVQRSFDGGLILGTGYRFREYAAAQTHAALFSAEQYFSNFRFAYTYSPSFVRSQTAHNHSVQLGYWYSDYSFVNLSYGIGNELNNIIPFGVVSAAVESYGINGRHWITPEWAITWSFSHQRQGNYYDRTGGQVGIRWAF